MARHWGGMVLAVWVGAYMSSHSVSRRPWSEGKLCGWRGWSGVPHGFRGRAACGFVCGLGLEWSMSAGLCCGMGGGACAAAASAWFSMVTSG